MIQQGMKRDSTGKCGTGLDRCLDICQDVSSLWDVVWMCLDRTGWERM